MSFVHRSTLIGVRIFSHIPILNSTWEAQTDVAAQNSQGLTALHYAAIFGHQEIVKALLGASADINVKSKDGWTALHYAACCGRHEVVKVLLSAGADINAKDNHGWTALHHAAGDGHQEVVKTLLGAGADINAKDNNGWTALHHAACYNRTDVAGLLDGVEIKGTRHPGEMSNETQSEKSLPAQIGPITPSLSDVELLSKLVSHHPTDHLFPRFLGSALWAEKNYSQAISLYEKSIQLDPSNASAVCVDQIHQTRFCDECQNDIFGICYRCTECDDFDLCINCYSKPCRYEHPPELSHVFLRIPSEGWSPSSANGHSAEGGS